MKRVLVTPERAVVVRERPRQKLREILYMEPAPPETARPEALAPVEAPPQAEAPPAPPPKPETAPTWGANNKLVSAERMAILRDRLKEILAERQAAKEAVDRIIAEADNDQMSIDEFVRSLAKMPLDKNPSK